MIAKKPPDCQDAGKIRQKKKAAHRRLLRTQHSQVKKREKTKSDYACKSFSETFLLKNAMTGPMQNAVTTVPIPTGPAKHMATAVQVRSVTTRHHLYCNLVFSSNTNPTASYGPTPKAAVKNKEAARLNIITPESIRQSYTGNAVGAGKKRS